MDHPILLAELAAEIHDQFPEYSESEILKRFLAWWFRGDRFPSYSDSTDEAFCEIFILQNGLGIRDITGYGKATGKSYGTNRYSLLGWLHSHGHLPANKDWRAEAYNRTHDHIALKKLYSDFASAIERNELVGEPDKFIDQFVIRTSLAIRFLLGTQIPIPRVLKHEIAQFLFPENTQGKKTGAEVQKGFCNEALDLLVSSGLYTPTEHGASTAAHLIFWIFKLGLRPDTIAKHIRDYHDQLFHKRS